MWRSVPQMDATLTFTRTSVGPNAGTFTSRISMPGAGLVFTTACIVSAMSTTFTYEVGKTKTLNSSIPTVLEMYKDLTGAWTRRSGLPVRNRLLVEFLRFAARNAQRHPLVRTKVLRQENDLSHMISVVR